ncbi:putative sulfate transporter YvdB [Cyberlindnera fabianii]|uniref:Putative sulfate transporter YvdB n=1 Tax=Cyberlindnera fabianii TaxID=36022 RepID=A0A1V2L563_CYBFA|nr:putative sulfate transporter YvdB [Cyberlindnera fabianii]
MTDPRRVRQKSLSGALSVSLGLSSSYKDTTNSMGNSSYLARSYLGFGSGQAAATPRSNTGSGSIDEVNNVLRNEGHKQAVSLAADVDMFDGNAVFDDNDTDFSPGITEEIDENTSLIDPNVAQAYYEYNGTDIESQSRFKAKVPEFQWSDLAMKKLASYVPAVILGLLLNILDGLSYGMIIFPIGEAPFGPLASAGLSMFYVSCVVSQLVYSLGGSAFKAGIGSEMIEVTPFFHAMAASITASIGDDHPDEIIATTITTYAISSIVTGLVFLILGKYKLGRFVGFFPRHILIGCIGGVGYFLVVTGLEVSSKLSGFEYNLHYLSQLFAGSTFLKWIIPVILTVILIILQQVNENSLVIPSYFIGVFIITHIIIIVVPTWDLRSSRDAGYMFDAGGSSNAPWYEFYSLYQFSKVDWRCILNQVPSMFALTFFGVLHVPINVPALAVSTQQDEVDVDRELIAHGISNVISGAIGSIQNYLVYTNSLLFMRAGADSRVAGVMLALATFAVMLIGPVVIGYIPVCVVGSLIFLLGYELLKEALYDTIGRVSSVEYATIVIIVLTMGVYDFVIGIIVGILLAAFHFLFENANTPVLMASYTGEVARSTVVRHPLQQQFLKRIGKQIVVLKLQSFLFFGTSATIEKYIKSLFEDDRFSETPVRYLILDFKHVLHVDYSAAEGFGRIKNFMRDHKATLIFSLGGKDRKYLASLDKVGIFDDKESDIEIHNNLNSSLESCENKFLAKYRDFQRFKKDVTIPTMAKSKLPTKKSLPINTPRNTNFLEQAQATYKKEMETTKTTPETKTDPEPLPLLTFSLQGLSNKPSPFWTPLVPLFKSIQMTIDDSLVFQQGSSFFLLVEDGVISLSYYKNDTREIPETLLPRTMCGRFSDATNRYANTTTLKVKQNAKCWILDTQALNKLKEKDVEAYCELMLVVMKLNEERFANVTSYALIST